MANRSNTRFVLMMVVLCLVAILCEGHRGGWEFGRRRLRKRDSGSGFGGGHASLSVGITSGVTGGIILMVVVYVLKNSSGNSPKDDSAQDVDLDNTNASTDHPYEVKDSKY